METKEHRPEYVSRLTVSPLQNFRGEIQFVTFPFESTPECCHVNLVWPGPQRGHAEIANLEASFNGYKDIGRLQVQMNNTSVVDKSETLMRS